MSSSFEHPEIMHFVDPAGNEIATTLAPVPRKDDRIKIENALIGAHTYRVVDVLRMFTDTQTHLSVASQMIGGGVFQVAPGHVYVTIEPDGGSTPTSKSDKTGH
jgi:hypothetical protein